MKQVFFTALPLLYAVVFYAQGILPKGKTDTTITVALSVTEQGNLASLRTGSRPIAKSDYAKFVLPAGLKLFYLQEVELFEQYELIAKWIDKTITNDEIEQLENLLLVDKTRFPSEKIKHKIAGLVHYENRKKVIILDKNNNFDFTDDAVYRFDLDSKTPQNIVLSMDFYINGKHVRRNQSFDLSPNDNYTLNPEPDKFALVKYTAYYGSFRWKKQYHLRLESVFQSGVCYNYGQIFINEYDINEKQFNKNEVLQYGNFKILNDTTVVSIVAYDTDLLNIKLRISHKNKADIPIGNTAGYRFPSLQLTDITGTTFDINTYKGKYLLLDIWGTWCRPCLAGIPDLVNAYAGFDKSKIEFLSIAIEKDGTKSIPSIQNICNTNKVKWRQVAQNLGAKSAISEQMIIQAFPTLILIDPNGMIVRRVEGGECKSLLNQIPKLYGK
jgi:thiol-disulfide isomerase/thioredoxin